MVIKEKWHIFACTTTLTYLTSSREFLSYRFIKNISYNSHMLAVSCSSDLVQVRHQYLGHN